MTIVGLPRKIILVGPTLRPPDGYEREPRRAIQAGRLFGFVAE
jgi:hypothetical protein